jgi:DNA-directed RNA polymerase specialized sigma24 family protein
MASQDVNDFFGSMYDTTQKKVLTYITSKCGKPEDISDIFQET